MSRTRGRIRRAVEAHGLTIDTLEWEPIRTGSEMGGAAGGWYVDFTIGGHALGYNADELIEAIGRFASSLASDETQLEDR